MPRTSPVRLLLLALCGLIPTCLHAQLPPAAATFAATPAPAPAAAPLTPAQKPAHHATITWQSGLLTIAADNSSLNQILREISRLTGMTITGGVSEERVFGTYGPAPPARVLDSLLNGTGSNMLLVLNDQSGPAQLILTPRHGGPSPPSPASLPHDDEAEDLPPQRQFQPTPAPRQPIPPQPTAFIPPAPTPSSIDTSNPPPQPTQPIADTPPTTTQQSPNGVKTPQQIFEELLKLQQQKTTAQ